MEFRTFDLSVRRLGHVRYTILGETVSVNVLVSSDSSFVSDTIPVRLRLALSLSRLFRLLESFWST